MHITVKTCGHTDIIDITTEVQQCVNESGIENGIVNLFVSGSTAALTTMEYEEGILEDFRRMLEKFAPEDFDYEHHKRWGDCNGAAHLRSALIGTDVSIPIENGKLALGTWQQIVLIDFDEKPRTRKIHIHFIHE
jgi:secondary thiamine-phosphate synthase enzyme